MRDGTRQNFPIFKIHPKLVYLDSAATAQVPEVVVHTMEKFEREERANVHRGMYTLSLEATKAYEHARERVAGFIGADADEIVFTSGTTASLNMLARMLEASPHGRKGIVTTAMEHHSAYMPFHELAKRTGTTFSVIGITPTYELNMDEAATLITEETGIVVVTLASNVLGTIIDVARVVERAHDVGALVVVDAAQSVGHMPVDVRELDCDFLAFSGHKLGAPMGTGVLFGKRALLEQFTPSVYGGGMVADIVEDVPEYVPIPHRFEAGTPYVSGAIGLATAIEYLTEVTVTEIRAHTQTLLAYAYESLGSIPGIQFLGPTAPQKNIGVISFTLEGVHPHDIADVCARRHVAIRAGHHCAIPLMDTLRVPATARASFYCYNTPADVDALTDALGVVRNIFL